MLVENKKQYCWVTPNGIGGPEDSVEQAVKSYLCLHRPDENADIVIEIGHPSFYIPDIDGDIVIESVIDQLPDEVYDTDEDYLYDVKREHVNELSEELTKVFRAWVNRHGYHHSGIFVENSEPYHIKQEEYKEIKR
ncbi:hypothetical protein [Veillonella atypica]|uniref:hypothetical protein n=1 Tax=Veillonella atypica TaxID=39777 RepID=UPI003AF08ABC